MPGRLRQGHEYFLKHYLGTHNNAIAEEAAKEHVREVTWHDKVELGKIDLVVDLNFRMDTSALYSISCCRPPPITKKRPEHHGLAFVHSPLQSGGAAVLESKTDWDIFKRDRAADVGDGGDAPARADERPGHASADARHAGGDRQPTVKDWTAGSAIPCPARRCPA